MSKTAEIARTFASTFKAHEALEDRQLDRGVALYIDPEHPSRGTVQDMVYQASNYVGTDFSYEATRDILQLIADVEPGDLQDFASDEGGDIDGMVDVYTHDLAAWLSSDLKHIGLCDEAYEEYGATFEDMESLMRIGQYHAYRMVAQAIVENWPETCSDCGDILDDAGDGYDGLCANCADIAEQD